MSEMNIPKTYKLFIGGSFPRSESGRSREVKNPAGKFVANIALASRKDAREAVVAARTAQAAWSSATAYNRGQVIYRIAEVLDGRFEQFVATIREATGATPKQASTQVQSAIDTLISHAGWTDKFAQVYGGANPVAGPFFNLTVPEPTGVVAVLVGDQIDFAGLVKAIVSTITTGNAVLAVVPAGVSLAAIEFAEVLATSDVPAGTVNILTGDVSEIAPWLASHQDVNGLDLSTLEAELAKNCEELGAETLKRIQRKSDKGLTELQRLEAFVEAKTVWHTKSLS